jgi:hypothetical protein
MRRIVTGLGLFGVVGSAYSRELSQDEFRAFIEDHCRKPGIACIPEMTTWTTVGFTFEGNEHREIFWLSQRHWNEFEKKYEEQWRPRKHQVTASSHPVGRPYIMSEVRYNRIDELETKKYRFQFVQWGCATNFAVCSYAITKMTGFWPGLVFTVTCTGAALACGVIAQNEIEKIDRELEVLYQSGHVSGSRPSSSGGASWVSGPFNPHAMPPLPSLPVGTVTIIDHPSIP